MTWTNWGFDGTINEAQWSQMAGLLGNGYVAADASSCVTTAVPGARSVSVSAGTLYGDGIVSVNSAAKTVAMTTPVNGQWYVIALRRTWSSNTVELVAVAGATTTTTTPTAPPSTLPTLNANPGVLADQPIAWAWCNSANTTVVVYDMRQFPVRRTPLTVANNVVRDGIFQTPTQGQQVWRNDLGAVETYFGAYNAISNPGGRDTAGWYVEDRAGGLVPLAPGSATIVSGSGSSNALGQINFSSATSVSLNNVFTNKFKNYRIVANFGKNSGNAIIYFRLRNNGTDTSSGYSSIVTITRVNGTTTIFGSSSATAIHINQLVNGQTTLENYGLSTIDLGSPFESTRTTLVNTSYGHDSTQFVSTFGGGQFQSTNSFDGFTFVSDVGTFGGTIQVFGYND